MAWYMLERSRCTSSQASGGGVLGDILLGREVVGAVEIGSYQREVLLARQADGLLPCFPIWDDVTTFRVDNEETREYIEYLISIRDELCIAGGFPCIDISVSGKGAGLDGEYSGLWFEMLRIVGEIRPKHIFVENSPMLTVRGLPRVLGGLTEAGYDCRWVVMGADGCGAPQRRNRLWLLGERRE